MVLLVAWLGLGALFLALSVVVLGTGYALTRFTGLRPTDALIVTPFAAFSTIAAGSLLGVSTSLGWSVLPVGITGAVLALLAWPARLAPRPSAADDWTGSWRWAAALTTLGSVLHLTRLARALGSPVAVSQTYDSPFHLNLIRQMLVENDGYYFHANLASYASNEGFYPALWHQTVSLLVKTTGADLLVANNAMLYFVTGVLWPLGVAVLLGTLLRSWRAAGVAGLLACALPQMPNHLTWFGVLYANELGYALLPFGLALLARLFFPGPAASRWRLAVWGVVVLYVFMIAHPGSGISLLVLAAPLATVAFSWYLSRRGGDNRRWRVAWAAGGVAVGLGVSVALNELSLLVPRIVGLRTWTGWWGAEGTLTTALWRVSTLNHGYYIGPSMTISYLLGAVVLVGFVVAFRRWQTAWLPICHLMAAFLYVTAYSGANPGRAYWTGLWYGDTERLVALAGITALPLLVLGTLTLGRAAQALLDRAGWTARLPGPLAVSAARRRRVARWGPTLVALAMLVLAHAHPTLRLSYWTIWREHAYDTSETIGLLSADEYRLLQRVAPQVPPTDEILGNPWNGSVFAPAVADRKFTFPHVALLNDRDAYYVVDRLRTVAYEPEVCQIVRARRQFWVLDFGQDYLWGGDHYGKSRQFPGLLRLVERGLAEVVDQEGEARLLRLTACD
ncbi:DUF6541 family protein [Buchananella hordeovulneris]|uniref:Glycosyltransferase RgtA/B/C/D-like domain-containing protein n=1 Tax=Buchananella hordeovulneris TaxID=52770 RepID=A0A1Q5PWZ0_9ACTO|nr:DUF6541 family protein [Buchananella hordeovulneris]OKL51935.1 hypothetical protein BSZ40_05490 [Buchananella hordeovulneris]RRD44618.1 hypothetical protein EII13_03865 [Buchananella hordeovulneris]